MKDHTRYKNGESYTVGIIVEAYKEFNIVAMSEEQAQELALYKLSRKHKTLSRMGFNMGDTEVVVTEKKKRKFK